MKNFKHILAIVALLAMIINFSSCLVVSTTTTRVDNGRHKGWTKNPNNPHHPNTTNPGHTKSKGKAKNK